MSLRFTVITSIVVGFATPVALGEEAPREVRSEFRQHVVRRDRLVRELYSLDQRAADAVAGGGTPTSVHAQQIEVQSQVDLLELRLETMAMRWNLEIPPAPAPGTDQMDEGKVTEARIEHAFDEGRARTDRALEVRCKAMLASIDYSNFLND